MSEATQSSVSPQHVTFNVALSLKRHFAMIASTYHLSNQIRRIILGIAFIIVSTLPASATNMRGQLIRYNPNSGQYYPLSNVRVDIWVLNPNGQWITIAYTFTDANGFYFFYNIVPGYIFQIQVFGSFRLQGTFSVIPVYEPSFQDIPQLAV
jgi:hypothetical protein